MAKAKKAVTATPVPEKDEVISEEKLITYGMIGVAVLISILLSGVTSTVGAFAENHWEAGDMSMDIVLTAFGKTLPVSLSALFIMFGWLRGWTDDFWPGFLYVVGVMVFFTLLVQPNGWEIIKEAWATQQSGLFGFPVKLGVMYLEMYWWREFVAGLISGAFSGWVVFIKTNSIFK
jgi:hypothetical protein